MSHVVSFWFEYNSPYSMITALRLLAALTKKPVPGASVLGLPSSEVPSLDNISIAYRPLFLGAIFKAIGQQALPNVQVPVKGAYMFHDVSRTLRLLGCDGFPTTRPKFWPRNSVLAGRMTWLLAQGTEYINSLDSGDEGKTRQISVSSQLPLQQPQTKVLAEFVWRVYEAEFIAEEDIGNPEVMSRLWDTFVVAASQASGCQLPEGRRAVELANTQAVKDGFRATNDAAVKDGVFGAPTFTTSDGDLYWGNDRLLDAVAHHRVYQGGKGFAGFCAKQRDANL
ncbi:hypothetical protein GGI12_000876 [Dipsacomyces acuminosporus]|nr:hypothetical protein GGI12_000876 [Dipsacomyces acuminosporus]